MDHVIIICIIIIAYCLLVKALMTVEEMSKAQKEILKRIDIIEQTIQKYHSEKQYPPFKRDSIVVIKDELTLKRLSENDPLYINHEVLALAGTLQKIHYIDYGKNRLKIRDYDFWIPFDCVILEKE